MIINLIVLLVALTLQDFVVNGDFNHPNHQTDTILNTPTTASNKTTIKCAPPPPSLLRRTVDKVLQRKPPTTNPELLLCKPQKPQSFFSKITNTLLGRQRMSEPNYKQTTEEVPLCKPGKAPAQPSFLSKLFGGMLGRQKPSCRQPSSVVATGTTVTDEVVPPEALHPSKVRSPRRHFEATVEAVPTEPRDQQNLTSFDLDQRGLFDIFKKPLDNVEPDTLATLLGVTANPKPPCNEGLIKKLLKGIAFQVPSLIDFLLLRKLSKFAKEEC